MPKYVVCATIVDAAPYAEFECEAEGPEEAEALFWRAHDEQELTWEQPLDGWVEIEDLIELDTEGSV